MSMTAMIRMLSIRSVSVGGSLSRLVQDPISANRTSVALLMKNSRRIAATLATTIVYPLIARIIVTGRIPGDGKLTIIPNIGTIAILIITDSMTCSDWSKPCSTHLHGVKPPFVSRLGITAASVTYPGANRTLTNPNPIRRGVNQEGAPVDEAKSDQNETGDNE